MKKNVESTATDADQGELAEHYNFDYRKSEPNRFANRYGRDQITVVLDPDVASVFKSAKDVNTLLRALIQTMPDSKV